jgi:hypothetical protein
MEAHAHTQRNFLKTSPTGPPYLSVLDYRQLLNSRLILLHCSYLLYLCIYDLIQRLEFYV